MRFKIFTTLFLAVLALIAAGCQNASKDNNDNALLKLMAINALAADSIPAMSQSALEVVNDSMSDINNSGETNVSYNVQYPEIWRGNPTIQERICTASDKLLSFMSAYAASAVCPGGGSVTVTDPSGTWNSANASFYVERAFNDCTGPFGLFMVSGNGLLHWQGLDGTKTGAAKIQKDSKLDQAPVNKRYTRILTGSYITVEGNGASISDGTLTGNVAHTINWSAVGGTTRVYSVDTDLTRTGYSASGSELFKHVVTTPIPLSVNVNMSALTRTISGTISIYHERANITMETTFSNVVIPMDTCLPSSGSASITISGRTNGSGSITYTGNGSADYTYTTAQGRTLSGSFVLSGCQ
jgi:hypothetical protein